MTDLVPVRRALISLSDKSGLEELAAGLARHGVEVVSTGGTAAKLRESGAEVRDMTWTMMRAAGVALVAIFLLS